jgi:hypothetical protein
MNRRIQDQIQDSMQRVKGAGSPLPHRRGIARHL